RGRSRAGVARRKQLGNIFDFCAARAGGRCGDRPRNESAGPEQENTSFHGVFSPLCLPDRAERGFKDFDVNRGNQPTFRIRREMEGAPECAAAARNYGTNSCGAWGEAMRASRARKVLVLPSPAG